MIKYEDLTNVVIVIRNRLSIGNVPDAGIEAIVSNGVGLNIVGYVIGSVSVSRGLTTNSLIHIQYAT